MHKKTKVYNCFEINLFLFSLLTTSCFSNSNFSIESSKEKLEKNGWIISSEFKTEEELEYDTSILNLNLKNVLKDDYVIETIKYDVHLVLEKSISASSNDVPRIAVFTQFANYGDANHYYNVLISEKHPEPFMYYALSRDVLVQTNLKDATKLIPLKFVYI